MSVQPPKKAPPSASSLSSSNSDIPPTPVTASPGATLKARAPTARTFALPQPSTKTTSGPRRMVVPSRHPLPMARAANQAARATSQMARSTSQTATASKKATNVATKPHLDDDFVDEDEYARFVRGLGLDDSLWLDDEEEEFQIDIDGDEDEEDVSMDLDGDEPKAAEALLPELDPRFYKDLEEELGSLLEEDLEAAVSTLVQQQETTPVTNNTAAKPSPETPLRDAARQASKTTVTYEQHQQLQRLLAMHYQLLVQQAVMAIRAVQAQKSQRPKEKTSFLSGETADDLAEILDGAVGMLQDLDQNRKDAIRDAIQNETANPRSGRRSLLPQLSATTETKKQAERRLTRAAFSKTLQQKGYSRRTMFDIKGLSGLKDTFATIDRCVGGFRTRPNIMDMPRHDDACRLVLGASGAVIDPNLLPESKDLSALFSDPREFLGNEFQPPSTHEQKVLMRRNRNLFTAGEDNLVLRGVNLYGEKQWILIADRYLPDRSVNIISQRYSKLCVMLYKAHGIHIDADGNLEPPPKYESIDDIDEAKAAKLSKTRPPAILNVHRWSLEEDLTLLKAVPLMGHMWAELGARLIPHRDRGHLRKRYQVLERRVKATVTRSSKGEPARTTSWKPPPKQASRVTGSSSRKSVPSMSTSALDRELEAMGHVDTSRTAFEKLVKETSADWSQMSKIKDMMESDPVDLDIDGSESPSHSNLTKMELDPNNASGLSLLNNLEDSTPYRSSPGAKKSTTTDESFRIMDSVLKGKEASEPEHGFGSPQKRPFPSTPSRAPRTQIYSTKGTPIGLSPGFRSPQGKPLFSPTVPGFSPAPSAAGLFASKGGSPGEGFDYSTFQVSEQSHQAFGGGEETNDAPNFTPMKPALPSVPNFSDQMENDDLEAISALNSLSASPARFSRKRQAQSEEDGDKKPSFFSRVVGGLDPKKRKLDL